MNESEQTKKAGLFAKPWVQSLTAIIIIFGALGGFLYWQSVRGIVLIENSHLDAPTANISATTPGMLNTLYVQQGQRIAANSQVAVVGSETLYAKDGGIVASAPQVQGSYYAPGQVVVSVVADQKMRVLGSIEETKGLQDISTGQHATFTVDAYPGKKYEGVVDEISATSNDAGVVFSISDKRPIKKFNVYVRYDTSVYPELKSGMSAKIKVNTSAK